MPNRAVIRSVRNDGQGITVSLLCMFIGIVLPMPLQAAESVTKQRTETTPYLCGPRRSCEYHYLINKSEPTAEFNSRYKARNTFKVYTVREVDDLLAQTTQEISSLKRTILQLSQTNDALTSRLNDLEELINRINRNE